MTDDTKWTPPEFYTLRSWLYRQVVAAYDTASDFTRGNEKAAPDFDRYDAMIKAELLRSLADELATDNSRAQQMVGELSGVLAEDLNERADALEADPSKENA